MKNLQDPNDEKNIQDNTTPADSDSTTPADSDSTTPADGDNTTPAEGGDMEAKTVDNSVKEKNSGDREPRVKDILTNKRVRYGVFSTLTALIVISMLVVVNLVVSQFDLTFDFSSEQMFSITASTKRIIENLEDDITIYALFQTGNENPYYDKVLDQYASNSSRIKVEYRDPYIYPAFVLQYGDDITAGSVIVERGSRYKVLKPEELYIQDIDYYTYTQTVSVNIEPKVTNAIESLMQENTPKLYIIIGHGEDSNIPDAYLTILSDKNFDYEMLDLMSTGAIPDDCDALIMTNPAFDYTADETEIIRDYLADDGKALIIVGASTISTPNLDSILSIYGVAFETMLILEGDSNYLYPFYSQYFYPVQYVHDITTALDGKRILVAYPQNVRALEIAKSSIEITPVLGTTNKSYGKLNPQSETALKEDDDPAGPFIIAAAITDTFYVAERTYHTRLVVSGADALLGDSLDTVVANGNSSFIVSSLNWLVNRADTSTTIPAKNLSTTTPLSVTAGDVGGIKVLTIGVLPGMIMVSGLVVWYLRRHR